MLKNFNDILLIWIEIALEDSTGTHAIYTTYSKVEMIFHVSTLLGHPQRDRSDPEWVIKISEMKTSKQTN
jgi:hypothetical protein